MRHGLRRLAVEIARKVWSGAVEHVAEGEVVHWLAFVFRDRIEDCLRGIAHPAVLSECLGLLHDWPEQPVDVLRTVRRHDRIVRWGGSVASQKYGRGYKQS